MEITIAAQVPLQHIPRAHSIPLVMYIYSQLNNFELKPRFFCFTNKKKVLTSTIFLKSTFLLFVSNVHKSVGNTKETHINLKLVNSSQHFMAD